MTTSNESKTPETVLKKHRGGEVMSTISPGDYVVASKYHDGDFGDHWAVGFYTHTDEFGRHHVRDSDGNDLRFSGFRRMQRIPEYKGRWLLKNAKLLEVSRPRSIWGTLRLIKKADVEAAKKTTDWHRIALAMSKARTIGEARKIFERGER